MIKLGLIFFISNRITLSGGGSQLQGVKELASRIFNKNVKVAPFPNIKGFSKDYNLGAFMVILGMLQDFAVRKHKKYLHDSSKKF